jgi:ABC-type lipoprotein export system ATPase subunit
MLRAGLPPALARLVRETATTIICATHDAAVIEQADAELALDGPIVEPP